MLLLFNNFLIFFLLLSSSGIHDTHSSSSSSSSSNNGINSYIYLTDKFIKEELKEGSFVADLSSDLSTNKLYQKQQRQQKLNDINDSAAVQRFTLLEESKYFSLDSTTGVLRTKSVLDREFLCQNRLCAEPCDDQLYQHHYHYQSSISGGSSSSSSCKLNIKVLMMPSYNILNLNVFVDDINDNPPTFDSETIRQKISENVPIGYKIPIDLAHDPDSALNGIDHYEIKEMKSTKTTTSMDTIRRTFELAQNLNESQLHLVVIGKLDRELISAYNFTIQAFDGGQPTPLRSSVNVSIEIVDINDNNPIFEKSYYRFVVNENLPVDSKIGQIKAYDIDEALNGQIKYSIVENAAAGSNAVSSYSIDDSSNSGGSDLVAAVAAGIPAAATAGSGGKKYFEIDERTGIIRNRLPLDYEVGSKYSLYVEARDMGVGSLPTYATVEIELVDLNDNRPEITVSFLNSLFKNQSELDGYNYDIYLSENTKPHKFIAHVNIFDKDSNENGRLDWTVLVNDQLLESSHDSLLKLIRLNNNSFTLNVGSNMLLLDRERFLRHNVSIQAWDHGIGNHYRTYYNFSLVLIDVNDNAPIFEKSAYEQSVNENNEPFDIIFKLQAHDPDAEGPNSNVSYAIKEPIINEYFYIDNEGNLRSKISFDREKIEKYIFHVIATDHGQPPMSSIVMVTLNVLDLNDNAPQIYFNTSFYHRFQFKDNKHHQNHHLQQSDLLLPETKLLLRLGENLSPSSKLMDFRATDKDMNENAQYEFVLGSGQSSSLPLPFMLTKDGRLLLIKKLDRYKQSTYDLKIVCRDFGKRPHRLNSTLQMQIDVVGSNEYCIQSISATMTTDENNNRTSTTSSSSRYINRDQLPLLSSLDLFIFDYFVADDEDANRDGRDSDDYSDDGKSSFILSKTNSAEQQQQSEILSFELLNHKDLFEMNVTTISSNNMMMKPKYEMRLSLRTDLVSNTSRLMLGKYTIKVNIMDNRNPTCNKQEVFALLVGNNFINEKDINGFLATLKQNKKLSNSNGQVQLTNNKKKANNNNNNNNYDYYNSNNKEADNIDRTSSSSEERSNSMNYDEDGVGQVPFVVNNRQQQSSNSEENFAADEFEKNLRVKPATYLMHSDYILLTILLVIIAIIALFMTFVGFVCFYSKHKKQYNNSNNNKNGSSNKKANNQLPSLVMNNENEIEGTAAAVANTSLMSSTNNSHDVASNEEEEELEISGGSSEISPQITILTSNTNTLNALNSQLNSKKNSMSLSAAGRMMAAKKNINNNHHHHHSGGSSSSSSSTASTSSSTTKPKYVLVATNNNVKNNNKAATASTASSSASSSLTSQTTATSPTAVAAATNHHNHHLYDDNDDEMDDVDDLDDEFGLLTHKPIIQRQFGPANDYPSFKQQQQQLKRQSSADHHQQHHHMTATTASYHLSSSKFLTLAHYEPRHQQQSNNEKETMATTRRVNSSGADSTADSATGMDDSSNSSGSGGGGGGGIYQPQQQQHLNRTSLKKQQQQQSNQSSSAYSSNSEEIIAASAAATECGAVGGTLNRNNTNLQSFRRTGNNSSNVTASSALARNENGTLNRPIMRTTYNL